MAKKGFTPHLWTYSKNNKKNEYKKGAGFTLMEILISVLILALVTTGLVYVFFAGRKHLLHTRSEIQAAELGRLFLAPFQMQVDQSQWDIPGGNCLSNPARCSTTDMQTFYNPRIDYRASYSTNLVGTPSLETMRVTVTWNEPSS